MSCLGALFSTQSSCPLKPEGSATKQIDLQDFGISRFQGSQWDFQDLSNLKLRNFPEIDTYL